jgi:TatD DNase family protein
LQEFINIHTHKQVDKTGINVFNLVTDYYKSQCYSQCSIGLHPWKLTESLLTIEFSELEKYAQLSNVVAIGECGLDRLCSTDWSLQERAFIIQVALANELHKPLIIHCVKAYSEVIGILTRHKSEVPVIFHGFNKNLAVAQLLIHKGYYLSFGASIIRRQNTRSFVHCPLSQVFFETDDADIAIEEVYKEASLLSQMPLDDMVNKIKQNYHSIITPQIK